jgi:hypothetical protein
MLGTAEAASAAEDGEENAKKRYKPFTTSTDWIRCMNWAKASLHSFFDLRRFRHRIREAFRYRRGVVEARFSYLFIVLHDRVLTRAKLTCGAHSAQLETSWRPSHRRCSTSLTGTHTRAGMRSSLSCKSSVLCYGGSVFCMITERMINRTPYKVINRTSKARMD